MIGYPCSTERDQEHSHMDMNNLKSMGHGDDY